MKNTIRYDLIGATFHAKINTHPKDYVLEMGLNVIRYEGVPIADCVFMEVEGELPEVLPNFIKLADWQFTEDGKPIEILGMQIENAFLFRFHKGTLDESMKTALSAITHNDLKKKIEKYYDKKILGNLIFRHQGLDVRNNWDTYIVTGIFEGEEKPIVLGHSNRSA